MVKGETTIEEFRAKIDPLSKLRSRGKGVGGMKLRDSGFRASSRSSSRPNLIIEQGLTGVVGPNGCGKSNLLEALRWVMGESSYKSMRASGMDDVIFSGTAQRPARNMAEVHGDARQRRPYCAAAVQRQ